MDALTKRGWQVHPQVGVSGFRVDLGIVHPDYPGRYLAGIECDGATYHSHATARDRDRLREVILTRLGWRIRRVWSREWWQGAEEAAGRLHEQLVRDLAQDRADLSSRKALHRISQLMRSIRLALCTRVLPKMVRSQN